MQPAASNENEEDATFVTNENYVKNLNLKIVASDLGNQLGLNQLQPVTTFPQPTQSKVYMSGAHNFIPQVASQANIAKIKP